LRRIFLCIVISSFLLNSEALSQTAKRPASKTAKPATTQKARPKATAKPNAANDIKVGAAKLGDKIKVITNFLYLFGRISSGIEANEELVKQGESSPSVTTQMDNTKAVLRSNFKNVREGLDELELHFRTTTALNRYYNRLAGVAAKAEIAEEMAAAGQYKQAGQSLVDVVNRLSDVLVEMR
jgi:hypothetical protein